MSEADNDARDDGGQDEGDGKPSAVTVRIDASALRESLRLSTEAMAGVRRAARQMAEMQQSIALNAEFHREIASSLESVTRVSSQMSEILRQNRATWKSAARMGQEISEALRPALDSYLQMAATLDEPFGNLAQTIRATRVDLRPILEASLAASATVDEATVAADRVLDEVTRAPEATEETDTLLVLVQRIAMAVDEIAPSRQEKLALLALLVALFSCWTSAVDHDEIKAGQERIREHVTEEVSGIEERLDEISERIEPNDGDSAPRSEEAMMAEKYEVVRVRRADRSVVPKAARFDDGRVFVPGCRIEAGDEIKVDGEKEVVADVEAAGFRSEEVGPGSPFSTMVKKWGEGCVVTFEEGTT